MKQQKQKRTRSRKRQHKTPEDPETEPYHPMLEDDPGAWSDQDKDWILQGRMP